MDRGVSIHIGVNHPAGMHDPLTKCEDTAWKLAELAFQAGYRAIHLLRGAEATRESVGALLVDAGRTLQSGQTLFVTFSGHGSPVRKAGGGAPGGCDERWCLHDADLVDDELAKFWRKLPRGARALVVADCCFAAGTIRKGHLPMAWGGAEPYAAWSGDVYRGVKPFQVPLGLVTAPKNDDGIGASVLLLAATSKQQKAKEGVYVGHLLDVWAGGAFRGSFSELHEAVRTRVMGETHGQEPQILMLGAPD
ncbi:MAG: caspase family protein, partial [Longimicrobiaceae bacterium]